MESATQVFRGLIGVAVLIAIAWGLSSARGKVNWRIVIVGVILQFTVVLALKVKFVGVVFESISGFFVQLMGFAMKGSEFVFGPLAKAESFGFIFACQVLPSIIFFSALTSLLYYLGILQFIVKIIAWIMSRAMGLSGTESLATAANIFVGQTEAPLLVKPYIPRMTKSELMALMTGGMATIAGAVMAAYIGMLGGDSAESQKAFAKLLLCASIMNAPAALYIAKILVPETGEVNRSLTVSKESVGTNVLDAVAGGTTEGLKLALNVGAMLIAFLALIAMVNFVMAEWIGAFGWFGLGSLNELVSHVSGGAFEKFSLEAMCGFLFAPIAWLIGVEWGETLKVGSLLGIKTIANEFVGFAQLADMKEAGALSVRSVYLTTFALCGFANFSSIGIQLGGIGALAPERRGDLASLALKALIGGTIASLLSASIAGIFFSGG